MSDLAPPEVEKHQRKYEMIICENTPQELPPDVVRSNSKVEDHFDNLTLYLSNIRNRFESGFTENQTNKFPVSDKSSLQRSESIHMRMQKYQSAVSGEKDSSYSSSDEESNDVKEPNEREKVVFAGMSSLKSQWEAGKINTDKDEPEEESKQELAELKKILSLGRSESLRHVYERACKESKNDSLNNNRTDAVVVDSSVKTNSIKEKFEKGNIETETEEEKIERLRKEREEEISVLAESETTSKEARNKFKQIDASVTRSPLSPTHQTNGFCQKPKVIETNGEVIRSGQSVLEDVTIDSDQLQERLSYFENLEESPKEPKRHQITPPRDVQPVVENNVEIIRDPNVIRSCDVIEDIPKVDTAKKMLDKFKALEVQKQENKSNGPKPIKRITPPRECVNGNQQNQVEPERDPNIIRSSLKEDDTQVVEPEKARNLKAKFENWSAEIDREYKRSSVEEEEEFIPHIDTTKNLRAKFEATIKDEAKPVDKPKPRVNRFVCETGANNPSEVCNVCVTRLYPMEKLEFSGIRIHKNCFRCNKCNTTLRLENFTITADKLYCIPHFKQLFMEKGNYDEGFGLEQHKDKWVNKNLINNNNDMNTNYNNTNNKRNSCCDVNENDAHFDFAHNISDVSDNDY